MKRLLSMLICLCMLISAMPMAMFAESGTNDTNPFIDVKPDRWYTEAVLWCYANGYMEGTSGNEFSPSGEMTRSMFATVLASVAGVDTASIEYKGSFTDVAEGKWYTGAVEWAAENEIVSGIGGGLFGYKNAVTRETLVLMVYKFMQYMGYDTSINVEQTALDRFVDLDEVHDWAREALTWAVSYDIISGTGTVNGEPYLSPRATATRAQVAVIIRKFLSVNLTNEHPIGSLSLNGTDISEFTIVYGETLKGYQNGREIAEKFCDVIYKATGIDLNVYADTEFIAAEGAKEILIGKTNREDAGLVTIDRENLEGNAYFYEMRDNYLIIASNELCAGTYLAMTRFCEDNLGYTYFGIDLNLEAFSSIKSVNIENGMRVDDRPYMKMFVNYQFGGWDKFLSPSESEWNFGNLVHSIPMLACGGCEGGSLPTDHSHHLEHYMDTDPCLSDSDNIDNVIKNIKLVIEKSPDADLFWVTQSDGEGYCKCDNCADIYRIWGRCATYLALLNYVGESVKEYAPDVKLVGLAYKYTMTAPNSADEIDTKKYEEFIASYEEKYVPSLDLTAPENVAMCICTDNSCYSHAIDDPNCQNKGRSNPKYHENFTQWCKLIPTIFIWDYLHADSYTHTVFPNIHKIWQNYNYFHRMGVIGTYVQGGTHRFGDFVELRSYLIARLNLDPTISFEEYGELVNGFLKTYYGDGWTYVREYIDKTEELSDNNEFHNYMDSWWNDVITEEQWAENYDYLRSLWEKALELANTPDEINRVKRTMTQILYVELQMAYHKYEASGNEEDLKAFRELNIAYADHLESVGFHVSGNWGPNGDPDKW